LRRKKPEILLCQIISLFDKNVFLSHRVIPANQWSAKLTTAVIAGAKRVAIHLIANGLPRFGSASARNDGAYERGG
jgi:hypothetical protein